ncbi:MAG: T9SS type A sorting domain-containing protein [Bacteroidetes bacterium]|nr:T9SS type A sorting domain-containing protein [Bacteroidota bacterium]
MTAIAFKDIGGVMHTFMATNKGVAYLHAGVWDTLPNLPDSKVTDIAIGPLGAIMVAMRDSGIAFYNSSNLNLAKVLNKSTFPSMPTNNIKSLQVRDIFCPELLCATDSGVINLEYGFLFTFFFTMKSVLNTSVDGFPSNTIQTVLGKPTCDSFVYVGTNQGLTILKLDTITNFNQDGGLPSNDVTVLELDPSGGVWIGTRDSGLVCLKGGNFTKVNIKNGLHSNRITAINCASPTNDCWVGTPDQGLASVGFDFKVKQKINLGIKSASGNEIVVSANPQPSYDYLYFNLPTKLEKVQVRIFSISGELVKQIQANNLDQLEIDVRDMPRGMYAYILDGDGNTHAHGRVMIDK